MQERFGYFKKGEDEKKLQKLVNKTVEEKTTEIYHSKDKYQAAGSVDDQELEIAAQNSFRKNILGKKGFDIYSDEKVDTYITQVNNRIHALEDQIMDITNRLSDVSNMVGSEWWNGVFIKINDVKKEATKDLKEIEAALIDLGSYAEQMPQVQEKIQKLQIKKQTLEGMLVLTEQLPIEMTPEEEVYFEEKKDLLIKEMENLKNKLDASLQ